MLWVSNGADGSLRCRMRSANYATGSRKCGWCLVLEIIPSYSLFTEMMDLDVVNAVSQRKRTYDSLNVPSQWMFPSSAACPATFWRNGSIDYKDSFYLGLIFLISLCRNLLSLSPVDVQWDLKKKKTTKPQTKTPFVYRSLFFFPLLISRREALALNWVRSVSHFLQYLLRFPGYQ